MSKAIVRSNMQYVRLYGDSYVSPKSEGAGLDAGSLLPSLGGRLGATKSHFGLNPVLYLLLNPTAPSVAEPHPFGKDVGFLQPVYVREAIQNSIFDLLLRK